MSVTADAKRAAHQTASSPWTEGLARAGLVAKGLTFALVAVLGLKVALGGGGDVEDRPGALHQVAETPFGRVLLGVLAIGLAGYALWRLVLAVLGRKLETGEREGALKRVADAARVVLYGWLAFLCAELVLDADEPAGKGNDEKELTARILDWPAGRWLVAAAGLAVLGAGAWNLYRALSQSFRKDLKEEQMNGGERGWYTAVGVAGHLARGAVFLLVGFFIVRAAWQYDPKEAIGLDGALAKIAHAEYGELLLGTVAVGLFAYALFCFVQARYRRV
jgi:hypothetical protein